jgi:YHS domain-containing protein
MKKSVVAVLTVLSFAFNLSAQKSEVFTTSNGAIRGYDAVAYFTQGRAVKGDTQFKYQWKQADWFFSSRQNLDSFRANPERYAPQYGGYCAFGMADGHKAPTDPEAFSIMNDKLYFNYNKNVQVLWTKKTAEYIQTADKNWPTIKNKE